MHTRIVIIVGVVALALGLGWFVKAQNGAGSLPTFETGQILTAEALNTIVAQVEANTNAIQGSDIFTFTSTLSRAQELPAPPLDPANPGTLTGGTITLEFDEGLTQVVASLTLEGDAATVAAAHLHCNRAGLTGPVVFGFVSPGPCDLTQLQAGMLECPLTNADFTGADCVQDAEGNPLIGRPVNNIAALFFALRDGLIYANVHTVENPAGEIRGQLIQGSHND